MWKSREIVWCAFASLACSDPSFIPRNEPRHDGTSGPRLRPACCVCCPARTCDGRILLHLSHLSTLATLTLASLLQGGTYGGSALGCAAAAATIDVIEEEGLLQVCAAVRSVLLIVLGKAAIATCCYWLPPMMWLRRGADSGGQTAIFLADCRP